MVGIMQWNDEIFKKKKDFQFIFQKMLNIVFELPFFFRPILHNVPKVQVCDVEIFR